MVHDSCHYKSLDFLLTVHESLLHHRVRLHGEQSQVCEVRIWPRAHIPRPLGLGAKLTCGVRPSNLYETCMPLGFWNFAVP